MTPQEIRCIALVAAALSLPGPDITDSEVIYRATKFEAFLRQPAEPFPWDKPNDPSPKP
jgi:hypothetical protein